MKVILNFRVKIGRVVSMVFISVLFFQNAYVSGQEQTKTNWYSIEKAMELTAKEPRKIIIDVYTNWCYYCKVIDSKTFSNPVIRDILNSKFYAVKFNAESTEPLVLGRRTFVNEGGEQRSVHQFAKTILNGNFVYPSIVYMDEKGSLLTVVTGAVGPEDMEVILNFFASNAYLTTKYEDYKANFKSSFGNK